MGDLCVVVAGGEENIGLQVTILAAVPVNEALSAIAKKLGFRDHDVQIHRKHDGQVIWKIDRGVIWSGMDTGQQVEAPYAADHTLMPIDPPAKQNIRETDKELTV